MSMLSNHDPDAMRADQWLPAVGCCAHCGHALALEEVVVKRGAIRISFNPIVTTWRGNIIPLSPTEAHVFAKIAIRGRATYDEIDGSMRSIGASPANRSVVLWRVRQKFEALGALPPLERVGVWGLKLVIESDRDGSTATVIGLRQPYGTLG